jgi:hypothetical protein
LGYPLGHGTKTYLRRDPNEYNIYGLRFRDSLYLVVAEEGFEPPTKGL